MVFRIEMNVVVMRVRGEATSSCRLKILKAFFTSNEHEEAVPESPADLSFLPCFGGKIAQNE
jgi:hypothetical protein